MKEIMDWIRNRDMRWVMGVIGFMTVVEQAIIGGHTPLSDPGSPVSPVLLAKIVWWCSLAIWVNGFILMGHAGTAATWVTSSPVTKALAFIAILLASMLILPTSAYAQTATHAVPRLPTIELGGPCNPNGDTRPNCQAQGSPAPANSVGSDLNALWAKIQSASIADLQYAKALSDAAGTPGGKMRSACWGAWIAVVQAQQGTNAVDAQGHPLGAKPDPALFTTAEQIAETVDSLQPTSPFMVACQPVANAFKMNVLQLVTMVVSGATTLGTLGIAIP